MRWIERVSTLAVAGTLLGPAAAAARQQAVAQVHALATVADESSIGAGLGLGFLGEGRLGGFGGVSLVRYRDAFAVRGELTVSLHLDPGRRSGVSPYAAAGAAFLRTPDGGEEYVVFVVGVEAAPRIRRRWFIEVGLGGGIRTAVGLRWRPPFLR